VGPIEILYLAALFTITLISFIYYGLAFWGLFIKEEKKPKPKKDFAPFVTVQIPVYNDRIVERLVKAVLNFDYPNYEVIIADDSTDPVTRRIVDSFASHPKVKVIRRNSREGFKAGALNNAMKYSKGDVIVVFDSDFIPPRDFLTHIVQPFKDPQVGYVQARWSFDENLDENLITVFAGTNLLIYHHLFYPFKSKQGTIYLSGSAMAIRRDAFEKVGGWKAGTLAEDAELTLRLASEGYKSVYLPYLRADNQLPYTLNVFMKQQARWSTGVLEAFFMNWKRILSSKKLKPIQKAILMTIPLFNLSYIIVTILVLASILLWMFNIKIFTPEIALLALLLTSGFLVAGYIALRREGRTQLFPKFLVATYLLGPLIAISNTLNMIRYVFKGLPWYVTPKRWQK